ncbi:MAG: FHA domain-containing protein [Acidobacteriota bacterium]
MSKLTFYLDAERERLKGNVDEALRLYREAMAADPNDWKLRECVADTLEAKGDLRSALKELFQAAHRLIWQQSYEDATRLLQKMLRLDPHRQFDVTKGVQACLDEIADALAEPVDELPVDADWASTREFLESLVLRDSTSEFRVPDDILAKTDRLPPRPPQRKLILDVAGRDAVRVETKEFLVGRAKDCHLAFKEGVVSRHHARIVEMDGHYVLQNWESRNGTMLNGESIQSCEISDGDTITFGLSGPEAKVTIETVPG